MITRFAILIFMVIFVSCDRDKQETEKEKLVLNDAALEKVNKFLVSKDAEIIDSYAKRRGWEMQMTESGLWYMIHEQGHGQKVEKNQIIELKYNVWLLDGTLCYSSDSTGVKEFRVGNGGVELGLEQGVLLLSEGDKARFIMPPHLAHGLLGDENRIPARSTILYDVEVLNVKK